VACGNFSSCSAQCINGTIVINGASYNADWYLPNGTASALMLLQHGFSRGCGNLRNTAKAIVQTGVMVLCLNADMSGGNPALGNALGSALASRSITPPAGRPLPTSYIVGGHSAGGHFASVVGARPASVGCAGLRGAILSDPVAGCTPNGTQVSRLRDFESNWARDLATGTRTAAYWCTDSRTVSTCGSKVTALTTGALPVAARIPVA